MTSGVWWPWLGEKRGGKTRMAEYLEVACTDRQPQVLPINRTCLRSSLSVERRVRRMMGKMSTQLIVGAVGAGPPQGCDGNALPFRCSGSGRQWSAGESCLGKKGGPPKRATRTALPGLLLWCAMRRNGKLSVKGNGIPSFRSCCPGGVWLLSIGSVRPHKTANACIPVRQAKDPRCPRGLCGNAVWVWE